MDGERVEVLVLRAWEARRADAAAVQLGVSVDELLVGIVRGALHDLESRALAVSLRGAGGDAWQVASREWWAARAGATP